MEQLQTEKITCRKLMLNVFMDCLIDNQVPGYLQPFWTEILNEYEELSTGNSLDYRTLLIRDVEYLTGKLTVINSVVEILRKLPPMPRSETDPFAEERQMLIERLRFYGFDEDFDTAETYFDNLDAIITISQSDSLELEQYQNELNEMQKNDQNKEKTPDYFSFFDGWLQAISNDEGHTVKATDISVASFCTRRNRILKRIGETQLQKQNSIA